MHTQAVAFDELIGLLQIVKLLRLTFFAVDDR